jgi:hypothetical protein
VWTSKSICANRQLGITQEGKSWSFHDREFTQLYPVKNVVADIIATTGLRGHAFRYRKGRGNLLGCMWLRDFLRKDFPSSRTMIYGYNSKLQVNTTHTILTLELGSFYMHSTWFENLIQTLIRQGESSTLKRVLTSGKTDRVGISQERKGPHHLHRS